MMHYSIKFQQYVDQNDHIKTDLTMCKKEIIVLKSNSNTQPTFKRS
jgi:hypothetical protein